LVKSSNALEQCSLSLGRGPGVRGTGAFELHGYG